MALSLLGNSPAEEGTNLECVKVLEAELSVCVHPAWSNSVLRGVQESLNALLFRYNGEIDGVVLAYIDLVTLNNKAKILSGLSPYFRVNLTAKLLSFSPKTGMLVEGKVNKVEEDYIGVLVLGLFNATISITEIRSGFQFVKKKARHFWVNESEKHFIELDSIIRFCVKSVEEKDVLLDLSGSLKPYDTGSLEWLTRPEVASRLRKMRKKHWKHKKAE